MAIDANNPEEFLEIFSSYIEKAKAAQKNNPNKPYAIKLKDYKDTMDHHGPVYFLAAYRMDFNDNRSPERKGPEKFLRLVFSKSISTGKDFVEDF